jgi:hypothetical protein
MRRLESLVLYKAFNALCISLSKLAWGKSFYDSLFVTSLASSVLSLFELFPFILFKSLLPTLSYL